MKKNIKKFFLILIIAVFASIALFFAGPISKKANLTNSDSQEPYISDKSYVPNESEQSEQENSFLLGNWKLKGEEDGNTVFLLLGTGGESHEAGYLTDTIIMASYNYAENKLGMLSIPRDLFIKMPEENYHTRINAVKYYADKKGGDGFETLKETLAEITGVKTDYYISFDFSDFENLIDKLDGIDIYLEEPVYDPQFPAGESEGYKTFFLDSGEHHISGKTALELARSRYSLWGDFDRAGRQQLILEGIFNKIKEDSGSSLDNALKFFNLWSYFRKNIETDIGLLEIRRILEISQKIQNPDIITKVLTSKPDGELKNARIKMGNGVGFVLLPKDESFDQIRKIAQEVLLKTNTHELGTDTH